MLEIHELKKSYGPQEVLRGVNLHVRAGEIVGLIGTNGAGKTTLASIVASLRKADSGSVFIDGIDALRNPTAARERLGFAPQEVGLYPAVSGYENLRFFGRLAGLCKRELRARIDELVHALDLGDFIQKRTEAISGGQARRLHTAVALLHRPKLLWLDEPTVGADIESRERLLSEIRRFAAEGTAIVYATHYFPEVDTLGAAVAILFGGRIIVHDSVDVVVGNHALPSIALTFDGDVPSCLVDYSQASEEGAETRVVVPVRAPAVDLARLIGMLGDSAGRLRSVELRQPSLESAFLSMTQKTQLLEQKESAYAVA